MEFSNGIDLSKSSSLMFTFLRLLHENSLEDAHNQNVYHMKIGFSNTKISWPPTIPNSLHVVNADPPIEEKNPSWRQKIIIYFSSKWNGYL